MRTCLTAGAPWNVLQEEEDEEDGDDGEVCRAHSIGLPPCLAAAACASGGSASLVRCTAWSADAWC